MNISVPNSNMRNNLWRQFDSRLNSATIKNLENIFINFFSGLFDPNSGESTKFTLTYDKLFTLNVEVDFSFDYVTNFLDDLFDMDNEQVKDENEKISFRDVLFNAKSYDDFYKLQKRLKRVIKEKIEENLTKSTVLLKYDLKTNSIDLIPRYTTAPQKITEDIESQLVRSLIYDRKNDYVISNFSRIISANEFFIKITIKGGKNLKQMLKRNIKDFNDDIYKLYIEFHGMRSKSKSYQSYNNANVNATRGFQSRRYTDQERTDDYQDYKRSAQKMRTDKQDDEELLSIDPD